MHRVELRAYGSSALARTVAALALIAASTVGWGQDWPQFPRAESGWRRTGKGIAADVCICWAGIGLGSLGRIRIQRSCGGRRAALAVPSGRQPRGG